MQKGNSLNIFKRFFQSGAASGIIIFSCVILSLILANSALGAGLQALLNTSLGFSNNSIHLRYPVQLWINDGLMAIFFLMVGLEIKREMIAGELATPQKALLPILCAIGGALTPALIYFIINQNTPTKNGWGIPMATDIAFALAIISMLSKRVPSSLKVFLAALAIVDDLLAILVIAFFYAGDLHMNYLAYAAGVAVLLFILNRLKVTKLVCYLIPGAFMWYFIHHSGIHATIAGVVTAMFIPATTTANAPSPLERLEHLLTTPVNFIIVPLFAFANTNIQFEAGMPEGLASPLGLGIIGGLLIGKPAGILFTSFISTKTGIAKLPENANWKHLAGLGLLAGIGFTMSIFVALLSFSDNLLIAEAKFSVLCASLLSATLGYFLLKAGTRHNQY
ncbi:Na+/H+ antiporter NhaA [Filimonas effusa]|uniref:Na(+)/H(+) antiporter NhaA n=1 Tax=Filimonas effusa TaxID=2508721 RepID=A0A4Q1DBH6_9BACT|nr:Na+/H+ antiporter NhaA [Filimonas effusa]RXK86787.1 Na+/H+ antiporter NhaA [Filimonas effusa]